MDAALQPLRTGRGAGLLLAHCTALVAECGTARRRLEEQVGNDLARLLVYALAGGSGLRGSSSP